MSTLEKILNALPQTQCGQCDYPGCKPYAEAIVRHEAAINRCPPGGIETVKKLAEITGQPYNQTLIDELTPRLKAPQIAKIREAECIGCTKCIQACPVDAILGAAKLMHVIITEDCTGCELCVEPCPMDCIDLVTTEILQYDKAAARQRYEAKLARGAFKRAGMLDQNKEVQLNDAAENRKKYIQEALQRVKEKKQIC